MNILIVFLLIVLISAIISWSYFILFSMGYKKGQEDKQKELDTDKVVINEKNRSIAKQIAQFYSYRG